MVFNSFDFALFVTIVFGLYCFFKHKWQNLLLLFASLIFYAWWDWRFLALIFVSASIDYVVAQKIHVTSNAQVRIRWLLVSLISNFSILGFFKYFNFFVSSTSTLLNAIGLPLNYHVLSIILPVGISFYTFEALSYTIDVYRGELAPTKRFTDFFLFVSFFPHLVAGPIMKAKDLLPQILGQRIITKEKIAEGSFLFLWGLYKKVFVADNLSRIVDQVFSLGGKFTGMEYLIALYAFAFQIYADFSGYSDMARGIGKWFGFDLMLNFNLPYFAKNPSEFWERWHISLSSWLKNYLYIPLGGNRKESWKTKRNLFITMVLGGLWHGASWTFVAWGAYQGLLLVMQKAWNEITHGFFSIKNIFVSHIISFLKIAGMFQLTLIGWLFFRAENFSQVGQVLYALFNAFTYTPQARAFFIQLLFFSFFLIGVQIVQYLCNDLMVIRRLSIIPQVIFCLVVLYFILIFGVLGGRQFIYFQF